MSMTGSEKRLRLFRSFSIYTPFFQAVTHRGVECFQPGLPQSLVGTMLSGIGGICCHAYRFRVLTRRPPRNRTERTALR